MPRSTTTLLGPSQVRVTLAHSTQSRLAEWKAQVFRITGSTPSNGLLLDAVVQLAESAGLDIVGAVAEGRIE